MKLLSAKKKKKISKHHNSFREPYDEAAVKEFYLGEMDVLCPLCQVCFFSNLNKVTNERYNFLINIVSRPDIGVSRPIRTPP